MKNNTIDPSFKVVSDNLRGNSRRGPSKYLPLLQALREGKTIKVNMTTKNASATLGPRMPGFKVHTHVTTEGLIVWADKEETE